MRVLFVEDNEDVRDLIGELLAEEGLEVTSCEGAEAAERAFADGRFELVLTDVSLPSMSGTELAKRLLARRPEQWVVFSSGYRMEIDPATWGPRVRSLLKPFDADELHAVVETVRADVAQAREEPRARL